jgi:hypothetical protein
MKSKTYRPRPLAVRTRADHECSECFGYPFHESWCKIVREN